MSTPDTARETAYALLRAVGTRASYANLTLPAMIREARLDGRDSRFATELSYGSLRMQGTLDVIIADTAGRGLDRIDQDVLDALRLGAYQLLYTRVPPHAAVSTSVDLVGPRASGFANAVLRKVARTDLTGWLDRLAPDPQTVAGQAIRTAHPEWIVSALRDALGGSAEVAAALEADNVAPAVHLVARGTEDRDALAAEVGGRPGRWAPTSIVLDGGDPAALAAVRRGRACVQD
ncbi:MAG: transcription antitermination factor NusB, partial [Mycobacteriales bacterium]